MNKKYLPSKKFIKVTFISLGSIVCLYFIILYAKTYRTLKNPEIITSSQPAKQLLEKDTDGDGVKDWEEILWGTNINSPATFNNMPDKDYVDDKKKQTSLASGIPGSDSENLNETEKFSREFFSTILALKESGTLNEFNIANLARKFSAEIGTSANLTQNYTDSDVKIGADTLSAKKTYYDKFSKALAQAYKDGMGYEMATLSTYVTSEDINVGPILEISSFYKTYTKSLLDMQVPSSARNMHLELLNISDNMSSIFKNIGQANENSIIGLIAVSQYNANEVRLEKTLLDFLAYFKANGIVK